MSDFKLLSEDDKEENRTPAVSVYSHHTDVLNEASAISCYTNLTNTIIGSGVLGLPFAIANTGLVLGILLLVASGVLAFFSLHLLSISASKIPPPASFYAVTEASVPQLTFLIDLAVTVQCFGVCSSYLIVVGGLMPDVVLQLGITDGFFTEKYPWILLAFAVVAPLSCFQKMDALKFTSSLSVSFVLFLMVMVFLYALDIDSMDPCRDKGVGDDDGECVGDMPMFSLESNAFRVLSIFVFAFSCQTNMFAVVNELENPSQKRFDTITSSAVLSAGSVYIVVAIAGFLTYGTEVDANILVSYPKTTLTTVARICVSLLVSFSYPILFLPGRTSVMGLWRGFDKDKQAYITNNAFRYSVVTIGLLGGSLATALLVEDLGLIFGLVGATGATIISFILPGISYYKMPDNLKSEPKWKRTCALLLCILGLVIMPVCTTFLFL